MTDDLAPQIAQHFAAESDEEAIRTLYPQAAMPLPKDMPPIEPGGRPVAAPLSATAATIKALVQMPRAVGRGTVHAGTSGIRTAGSLIDQMLNALPHGGPDEENPPDQVMTALDPLLEAVEQFIPPPETAVGRGAEAISRFLTGFAATRRMLGAWRPAAAGGELAKSTAAGGIADGVFMDAQAGNLADLIQSVPELQNPITEFLATDSEDGEVENRLRNALSGMGSSLLVEGGMAGFKVLRAATKRMLRPKPGQPIKPNLAAQATARAAKAAELEIEEMARSWAALGYDPLAPVLKFRSVSTPEAVARQKMPALSRAAAEGDDLVRAERLAAGEAPPEGGERIFINYARIDTPDDIAGALDEMTRGQVGAIDAARRGVRSWAATELSAGRIKAFDALMESRAQRGGAIPTAERQLAMRQLWAASGDQLIELGAAVVRAPSDANRFLLKKATAVHFGIQEEVIAARTETARALNAWKIPAGTPQRRLMEMRQALDGSGDTGELARILASMRGSEDQLAGVLDDVVRGSVADRTGNALLHIWINGLLSGPQTHVVNTVSNASVLGIRMLETKIASGISRALDTEGGGVAAGEALALWRGYVEASKDLFKIAGDDGSAGAFWRYLAGDERAKALVPLTGKIEKEGLTSPLAPEVWGQARDTALGYAMRGVAATAGLPGEALKAQDYLFKVLHYRATLHAAAVRETAAYAAVHQLDDAAIKGRIAALLATPSQAMLDAADQAALLGTFTNPTGKLGNAMMALRGAAPGVPVLLPFVRTPVNLFRYYAERSPLAPLVGQWRADIAAGGARRDLALARLAMGTTAFLAAFDLAQNGVITGRAPANPAEREHWQRTGRQEYSFQPPGSERAFAFSRLDPLGFMLGTAADLAQVMGPDFQDDLSEDASKAVSGAILAAAWNMSSKTYMSGIASLMQASVHGSGTTAENWFERLAGSAVPTGVAAAARAIDPVQAEVNGVVDALMARTPWMSKDLPAAVDLWGRPRTRASGLGTPWDVLSPIRSTDPQAAPIDRELERLRYFPERAGPVVRFSLPGLPDVALDLRAFDPVAFNRYQRLAGNEAPLGPRERGTFDTLNAAVEGIGPRGVQYQRMRDGDRERFIRTIITQGREAAAAALLRERPDLLREVTERGQLMKAAGGLR